MDLIVKAWAKNRGRLLMIPEFMKSKIRNVLGPKWHHSLATTRNLNREIIKKGAVVFLTPSNQNEDTASVNPLKTETLSGLCDARVIDMSDWTSFRCEIFRDTTFLIRELFYKQYCIAFLAQIRKHFVSKKYKKPVFVDCGANIGLISIVFLRKLQEFKPELVAFEPSDINFGVLSRNLEPFKSQARLEKMALGSVEASHMDFYFLSSTGATTNKEELELIKKNRNIDRPIAATSVPVTTLDLFANKNLKDKQVALMKLDTEGAEEDILAGAKETIRRDLPAIICSYEHYSNNKERIVAFIKELGPYEMFDHPVTRSMLLVPKN